MSFGFMGKAYGFRAPSLVPVPVPVFDWRADLAAAIPAGFTFTRASAQNVFDGTAYQAFSSGNIGLIAGVQKGYFSEPARTNMQFHSSDFTLNASSALGWQLGSAAVLTNLGADAIGLNAWDLDTGATTNSHGIFNRTSATALSANYIFHAIAKYVDWPHMLLRKADPGATAWANFNLQTAAVTLTSGSPTVSRMTLLSNGWYLCEIGWLSSGVASSPNTVIAHSTNASTSGSTLGPSFLGTDASFKLGHAQTELTDDNTGPVATSPIVTSGASASRAACVLSGPSTPAQFTYDMAFSVPAIIPTGKRVVALAAGGNVALVQVTDAGLISMFDGTTTTTVAGDERGNTVQVAVSFDGTTLRMSKNLGAPVTLVPALTPVGQALHVAHQAGDMQLRAFFQRLTGYSVALT